jgi:uncharacterized protein YhfF
MIAAIMFSAIGLYLNRPVIVIISLLLLALGIWSRRKLRFMSSPELVMWEKSVKENPEVKKEKFIQWHYGKDEKTCQEWLKEVQEKKICGASYFAAAFPNESNPPPQRGQYSILLDWWGNPQLIIQTVGTETVSFRDVTPELVQLEGFSDREQWVKIRLKEYKDIAKKLGIPFSEELPIMFETFQVVFNETDENLIRK